MAYHEVAMKVREKNRGEFTSWPTMRWKFLCGFLIALSSKKMKNVGSENCIALFNLFLGRVCVGVALIDKFSSIATHHCPDPTFKDKLT